MSAHDHECQCAEHDCKIRVDCDGICAASEALHLCPHCFSGGHSPGSLAVLGTHAKEVSK